MSFFKQLINNQKFWKEVEYFDPAWKARIQLMSSYLDINDKLVCDIGCGKEWLREFLPENVEYYGVDYVQRSSSTIVCDINNKELPNSLIMRDVVFCSGVIEYIDDIDWFISSITAHSQKIIISYCGLESFPKLTVRKALAWKNHYYSIELIKFVLGKGFVLKGIDQVNKNMLMCFELANAGQYEQK